MPTQVSDSLRNKLRTQKRGMNQSRLIDNKNFTKMRMRVLPRSGGTEVPGVSYVSFYGPTLGDDKATTSPEAFGVPCPVLEAYNHIMLTGDDDQKKFARENCRITREYWMAVVDQDDPGEAEAPNIKVHRAKKTVYSEIVDLLLDEDDGKDITDFQTGADIRVRKEGSGIDTEWKTRLLDSGPVSEDPEYIESLKAACKNFDPMKFFYRINLGVLQNLYEVLTGEAIPEDRLDEIKARCPVKGQSDEETPKVDMTGGGDDDSTEEGGDGDEGTEEGFFLNEVQVIPGETLVTFEFEGDEITNVVLEVTKDNDGDTCLKVKDENDPDEPWTIYPDNVTNAENPEAEEPEEAEPTEEKPKKGPSKKKGPAKGAKKTAKKSAPKKSAPRKPAKKAGGGKKKTGGMKDKLSKKKKKSKK